ncbi:MAG: DEAD/DEAH box helicase [Promethearchaeota archaeon]
MPISQSCPFCNNFIPDSSSQVLGLCPNKTCKSHSFIEGNRVIHRYYPNFGIGTVKSIKNYSINSQKRTKLHQISRHTPDQVSTSTEPNSNLSPDLKNFYKKIKVDFPSYLHHEVYLNNLAHFLWKIGQKVRISQNLIGIIQNCNYHHASGLLFYHIVLTSGKTSGKIQWFSEAQIIESIGNPIQEFMKERLSETNPFLIRLWARQILNLYESNYLKVVTNSRLALLPHQISVAHFLLQQPEARMILADEVGLGKTIEAGIYIKEMLARKLARRILIISPASLASQWEFEMSNKFNLDFTRLTSQLFKQLDVDYQTGNYFHQKTGEEFNLCSVSLQFARLPQCSNKLLQIEWDIVIFDEAHHLRRYLANAKTELYRSTLAFELAEQLAKKSKNMLLLTATPIQLHSFDLYSLICILNPYRFPNFDSFETERKNLVLLNLIIRQLFNFTRISAFERSSLTYNILNFLPNYGKQELDQNLTKKSFREQLISKLEQHHFLSDFVIRNRRKRAFPNHKIKRVAQVIDVTLTPEELQVYNKIHLYLAKIYSQNFEGTTTGMGFVMVILQKLLTSSVPAILKSLKKRIQYLEENEDILTKFQTDIVINSEFQDDELDLGMDIGVEEFDLEDRYIYYERKHKMKPKKPTELNLKQHVKILKEFVTDLTDLTVDSKVTELQRIITDILKQNPKEKIIIFTQFKATLFYLSSLFQESGLIIAHFHGNLDEKEKNREVQKFKGHAQILLSTEIGGEGRNFQFCHIVVNYDLPWNPMRLEQRIGRLDRIGQTKDIIIFNFYIAGTVESSIVNAIIDRIHLFEESIGSLEPILGGLEKQITKLVLKEDEVPYKFRLEDVISKTSDKIEEVYNKLEDFILDKKSFQSVDVKQSIQNPLLFTGDDLKSFLHSVSIHIDSSHSDSNDRSNIKPSKQSHLFSMNEIKKIENHEFWKVSLSESLRTTLHCKSRFYNGVFDINLAQKFEEFDFFALGHEVIMRTAEFCSKDDFSGFSSILDISASLLVKYIRRAQSTGIRLTSNENIELQRVLRENEVLHLFFVELKTTGIIIEKIIYPLLVSDAKVVFTSLLNLIYHPTDLKSLIYNTSPETDIKSHGSISQLSSDTEEHLTSLYQVALKSLKAIAKERILYLTGVNRKRFFREKNKVNSDASLKRAYIQKQLENLNIKMRVKKVRLPTKKQLENVAKVLDPKKKKIRLDRFEKIRREVEYLENEIIYWQELEGELDFDVPSKLKKLKHFKTLRIDAQLVGYARVVLHRTEKSKKSD